MFSCYPSWRRLAIAAALLFTRSGFGAPALTTIQDTLYKADGTRFNGTIYITWTNFQDSGGGTVPIQAIAVQVNSGSFKTQLIPTTTASPGANYTVQYNSQGKFQFSEIWAVPPSATPLRVRDVRISTGTSVGPPPVLTQVQISDVIGLPNELALRTMKGSAFSSGRAAVINASGQIDAASGSLTDCLHVDGSSGACGSANGAGFVTFVDNETPAGIVDGANLSFALQLAPMPASSLFVHRNGLLMRQPIDYSVNGSAITFVAASAPQPGDVLAASYRVGDPSNPLASFAAPQVICSSSGTSTSATSATILGSCTIPANVLKAGDRVEIRFDYAHQGTSSAFTGQVVWGASTLMARSGIAAEAVLSGRSGLGIHASGAQWSSESWGSATAYAVLSGNAPDSLASPIQMKFLGNLASTVADSITLRNFTVARYPAQSNP